MITPSKIACFSNKDIKVFSQRKKEERKENYKCEIKISEMKLFL